MKILKGPEGWSRKVRCKERGCKTLVQVNADDVRSELYGSGMDFGDQEWQEYVECPSCKSEIILKNVPEIITEAARKKTRARDGG